MSTIQHAADRGPASFHGSRIFYVGRKRIPVRRMKPLDPSDCCEKPLYVASVFNPRRNILFGGYDRTPIGSIIVALTVCGFKIKRNGVRSIKLRH